MEQRPALVKPVSNLIRQFLVCACHEIAYVLRLHPVEFYSMKHYGHITLHENKNREIKDYIEESVGAAVDLLTSGGLESFVFVVTDAESDKPLERYVFRATLFPERSTDTKSLQEKIYDLLLKIGFENGDEPPRKRIERNFRCLVIAHSHKTSMLQSDNAWTTRNNMELSSHRKEIIPLGYVDSGMLDLKVDIHRYTVG